MPSPTVTVYTANHWPNEDGVEEFDVYVVFQSGVVMMTEAAVSVTYALNSVNHEWGTSIYGEQHVREIFFFEGYYPAPCAERI